MEIRKRKPEEIKNDIVMILIERGALLIRHKESEEKRDVDKEEEERSI